VKLDSTMIRAHMACPRSYYWRYIRHIKPKSPAAALNFGGAIHKGLEVMHKKLSLTEGLQAFAEAYPEDLDDRRTQKIGRAILTDYYSQRASEFGLDIQIETGFAYEIPYNADGEHHHALIVGRIDRIRKGRNDPEEIWISDWKTASRIGPSYINKYVRDIQMGIYYLGCTFITNQCDGVAIDVLPVQKTTTQPQLYEFDYSTFDDQILEVLSREAEEIHNHTRSNFWPEKWTHCSSFGACSFQDLCYHPEFAERTLDALYEYEIWEPWKGIIKEDGDGTADNRAGDPVVNGSSGMDSR